MSSHPEFKYVKVTTSFYNELATTVHGEESIVLVGPRYGGKRHVMIRLYDELHKQVASPIVYLKDIEKKTNPNHKTVTTLIKQAVKKASPDLDMDSCQDDDLFEPIDLLYKKTGIPVILLAANVDSMAHHVARNFLQCVQTRVQEKKLIVVLSGEDTFRDLVHGPNSEFTCANQYVLQGFDEDAFTLVLNGYIHSLNFNFEPREKVAKYLWERTGGNIYILRMLLWALVERSGKLNKRISDPVTIDELNRDIEFESIPFIYGANIRRHTIYLIAREPDAWIDLEELLNGRTVNIRPGNDAPGALELAALAIREGNVLRFASPIMRQLAQDHFGNRRLGDLYARNGQWDRAFEYYARMDPEDRVRPASTNDRGNVQATATALAAALYAEATEGPEKVKALFTNGCKYVLGFQNVTYWKWDNDWKPQDQTDKQIALEPSSLLPILPFRPTGESEIPPVIDSWNQYVLAAVFPSLPPAGYEALIVGDYQKEYVLSRERKRIVTDLLEDFLEAYNHAVSVERTKRRLERRDKHIAIINSILDALGRSVLNVRNAIAVAANGLRDLGYRRAHFCIVDSRKERIIGILDDSDDCSINVATLTDYQLDKPLVDIQPYVIHTREAIIINDAEKHPLTNKDVIRAAKIKTLAIVPILTPSGEAIGTIHIERDDQAVPSREEVDDLIEFGRMLAVVIRQSERTHLQQQALDKISEPILIIDSLGHVQYGNEPANNLFGVEPGWHHPEEAKSISDTGLALLVPQVRESLNKCERRARYEKGIGKDDNYCGVVVTDHIHDWRKATTGAIMHIENFSYVYRLLEALRHVAGAKTAETEFRFLLEGLQQLGLRWGRLYLVDSKNPEQMVSRLSFGWDNPESQKIFDGGKVSLLQKQEKGRESWWCINQKRPFVFCWKNNLGEGEEFVTDYGLRAINVPNPKCPELVKKRPGDFWMDFPLLLDDVAFGKVTLCCDETTFRADDIEKIQALSEMGSSLLGALFQRDVEAQRRERLIRDIAESTVALTAHNVKTRLAALPVLHARYEKLEDACPKLTELNKRLEHFIHETWSTLDRIKERLSNVDVHRERFDLIQYAKQTIGEALPQEVCELISTENTLKVYADPLLIGNALLELVQNAKDTVGPKLKLIVSINTFKQSQMPWVRIIISDNGSGVPEEFKERIFEAFFSRRPGEKTSTGLGLTFVQRVALAHGGRVYENGAQGAGARFVIELPCAETVSELEEIKNVSHFDC